MRSGVYSGYGLFSLLLRWGPTFRKKISKALKMEALRFSATLVVYNKTTQHHIPEDYIGNSYISVLRYNSVQSHGGGSYSAGGLRWQWGRQNLKFGRASVCSLCETAVPFDHTTRFNLPEDNFGYSKIYFSA